MPTFSTEDDRNRATDNATVQSEQWQSWQLTQGDEILPSDIGFVGGYCSSSAPTAIKEQLASGLPLAVAPSEIHSPKLTSHGMGPRSISAPIVTQLSADAFNTAPLTALPKTHYDYSSSNPVPTGPTRSLSSSTSSSAGGRRHSHGHSSRPSSSHVRSASQSILGGDKDKPYKCEHCSLAFSRNHDLKRHRVLHMSIKPFACPGCNKQFARRDAIKRHFAVKDCGKRVPAKAQSAALKGNPLFNESQPADIPMSPNLHDSPLSDPASPPDTTFTGAEDFLMANDPVDNRSSSKRGSFSDWQANAEDLLVPALAQSSMLDHQQQYIYDPAMQARPPINLSGLTQVQQQYVPTNEQYQLSLPPQPRYLLPKRTGSGDDGATSASETPPFLGSPTGSSTSLSTNSSAPYRHATLASQISSFQSQPSNFPDFPRSSADIYALTSSFPSEHLSLYSEASNEYSQSIDSATLLAPAAPAWAGGSTTQSLLSPGAAAFVSPSAWLVSPEEAEEGHQNSDSDYFSANPQPSGKSQLGWESSRTSRTFQLKPWATSQ